MKSPFGAAVATVLGYDRVKDEYVTGEDYELEVSAREGSLDASATWYPATSLMAGTHLVTPAVPYSLDASVPFGRALLRIDRYVGTDPAGATAPDARWEPLGSSAITVSAGDHEIYRLVYASTAEVMLPLTGGRGADAFLLGGAGVFMLGLLGAVAHRRRRWRETA